LLNEQRLSYLNGESLKVIKNQLVIDENRYDAILVALKKTTRKAFYW